MRSNCLFLVAALVSAAPAAADPICRAVEIRFAPGAPDLQIAVWIETAAGAFVDTAYVTRLTGQFGLGNRPGTPLLKTDFRWPYGRREMVLPVWAHRRNHPYRKVVMGGACGNSPDGECPDHTACGGDCVDSTIAYHPRVSSYEPFFCSPSGPSKLDALSCASKGSFAKGAYADAPAFSLYPPRADLTTFTQSDGPDAKDFAKQNDLVAISRATPPGGSALDPALTWYSPGLADGDYVAFLELSQEADFNGANNWPNQPDAVEAWDFEGHPFLGQPSVVYKVPFTVGADGWTAVATSFAGYGSWDGSNGDLHSPDDGSITVGIPGTGAGRLLEQNDGIDDYRVKLLVGGCPRGDGGMSMCGAPQPVTDLKLSASPNTIDVAFTTPSAGVSPNRFSVRYREGDRPITDGDFDQTISAMDPPMPGRPGDPVTTEIHGLLASTSYTVAARGISPCNQGSHVVSTSVNTADQKFTTLHGCFIATAAYGSPGSSAVTALRRFRDERLLDNAAGRLFVASYYALSPSLASAIASDRRLRALVRFGLAPLVERIERRETGSP